jgi:sugar/nucleoside kinase (ribokinase family)
MEYQVVVAGHICFDITPKFLSKKGTPMQELFIPGKLINMGEVNVSTGGPVSNTGIALQKMGVKTKLMGKVGNDYFGSGVIDLLKKQNNHDGMIVMDGEETSYTVVIVPPGVDRVFLHNPGANNTFGANDLDYDFIAKAQLFHLGYPPLMKNLYKNDGQELSEIFRRVKETGVTTSLDMSIPDRHSESGKVNWEKILEKTLPYVDLFLPSYEEITFMVAQEKFKKMVGNSNPHDLLDNFDESLLTDISNKILGFGAKVAVIKCGEKGFYIRTAKKEKLKTIGKAKPGNLDNWANREIHEESYHVEDIASATGSGDSSIAGFLSSYLNGLNIEQAVKMACAAGAQNITQFDALSGIKDWNYTQEFVNKKPNKNKLNLGNGWTYINDTQQWERK